MSRKIKKYRDRAPIALACKWVKWIQVCYLNAVDGLTIQIWLKRGWISVQIQYTRATQSSAVNMVKIDKIFSCKAFYSNCNLTDRIRTFGIPYTKFGNNLHEWLLLFHLHVFTCDYNIFSGVCIGVGGRAFWHNSSNVYDIFWTVTCTFSIEWKPLMQRVWSFSCFASLGIRPKLLERSWCVCVCGGGGGLRFPTFQNRVLCKNSYICVT